MSDERAERAVLSHAEAYRLVDEAREQRARAETAEARAERLAVALTELRAALHRYGVQERYLCELQESCEYWMKLARWASSGRRRDDV